MNSNVITVKNLKLADASGLTFVFKKVSEKEYNVRIRELRKTIVVKQLPNGPRNKWTAECVAIMNNGYGLGSTPEEAWKCYIGLVNYCCSFE